MAKIKRKYFNKNKFFFRVITTLALVLVMPMIFQSVAKGGTEIKYEVVTVQSGDNMWNIASRYTPSGRDVRGTIERIKAFNGLELSALDPGMEIKIPSDVKE